MEDAWIRYAVAYEARDRLLNISASMLTLTYRYDAAELARLKALEERQLECNARLLEYFEIYDADQREVFG